MWESHNALRACPAEGNGQRLLSYSVETTPEARVFTYVDRWGTRIDTFGIMDTHNELVVTARSRVTTSAGEDPHPARMPALLEDSYREQTWLYLQPTRHTRWGEELAGTTASTVAGVDEVTVAVSAVVDRVRESMDYQPGATEIGVSVDRIWESGVGVCQDFAHLIISMLRSVGIGARYVSGYYYAADSSAPDMADADEIDADEIVVATHAWVEVAVPGSGWWPIDPTNAAEVGEHHVKIGHGRDYDDVTPLRGVYFGESDHLLAAEVTMSRGQVFRTEIPHVDVARQQQQ